MKKILIIVAAVLVVLAIGVVVALSMSVNAAVKLGVETFGPKFTGAPVTLQGASISPFSGKGTLKGLVVGNPEGYKTEYAFKLDEVEIELDVKSLTSDTIVIKRILIDGPGITYELGLGESNIGKIKKNLMAALPAGDGTEKTAKPEDTAPGKKIIIDDFQLVNAQINLSAKILQGTQASLPMPDVKLKEIGRKEGGTSPAAAMVQLFSPLTQVITDTVKSSGKLLEDGVESVKDVGKAVGDKAKDVGKGIKGIFSKDK